MSNHRRQRFLNAFTDQQLDRPPVWIMRQAGRYLPEYRELRTKHSFVTMVSTPELATEVTLQPLRRFPQLDAAILFSDILVLPEAMGQPYHFRDGGGIQMEFAVRSAADIDRLQPEAVADGTRYQPDAIRMLRSHIGDSHALLGFAGAPWTLATYMVEGGSSRDYSHIFGLMRDEPALFDALMSKIVDGLVSLLNAQIDAGVDAVQIFDSWAGIIPHADFERAALRWTREVMDRIGGRVPVILFAKGVDPLQQSLASTGAAALAAGPEANLPQWRKALPAHMTLQGNLDPSAVTGTPDAAAAAAKQLLDSMSPFRRYIFNLGHGITPDARIESLEAVLNTVTAASHS